ncbi:uncharacterized protein [Lepisosteus oculatus]|uniref:uncharacterized protein n=1 Tax=Lepisosteus oculatus TaxID=7918 RepID=UPI0035F51A32
MELNPILMFWIWTCSAGKDYALRPKIIVNSKGPEWLSVLCYRNELHKENDTIVFLKDSKEMKRSFVDSYVIKTSLQNSGNYSCKILRDGQRLGISSVYNLTILGAPELTISPDRPVAVKGETLTITCRLTHSYTNTIVFYLLDSSQNVGEKGGVSGDKSCTFTAQAQREQSSFSCQYQVMAETGWLYSESSAAVNVSVLDLPRPAITLDQTKSVIHCSAPPSVNCSSFSLHRETHPEPLAVESTAQHAVAFTGVSMTEGLKYTCRCQLTASGWLLNSTFSLPVSKEAGGFEMWLIVVTAGALVLVFSAAALCFCKMRRGTARMDTQIWSGPADSHDPQDEVLVQTVCKYSTLHGQEGRRPRQPRPGPA